MKSFVPVFALWLCFAASSVRADSDDVPTTTSATKALFGTLDSRSKYYTDWYPEPFRVEDTSINNELRFDWEHDETKQSRANTESLQIQKSVGIFTFEVQASYRAGTGSTAADSDDSVTGGQSTGFGDVELAARLPLYQSVSNSGFFDNTVGFNFAVGIPTNSAVGKNAEVGPGLFDDLAVGNSFSVQTLFTFSHAFGSVTGGRLSFEYGLAFGYAIEDETFRVPSVERLIPSLELVGNTPLDGSAAGHDVLTGTVGLRAEFKAVHNIQPSFGVGYVFPIDKGGRGAVRWGIIASLTFDF